MTRIQGVYLHIQKKVLSQRLEIMWYKCVEKIAQRDATLMGSIPEARNWSIKATKKQERIDCHVSYC